MAVVDVFGELMASIRSYLPAALQGGALHLFDWDEIEQFAQSSPPAIGVELVGDTYAGPKQGQRGPGLHAGSLATAETRVRFHIWAQGESKNRKLDLKAVHELRRQWIAAMHSALHGSYRLENGTFHTEGVIRAGVIYTFTAVIDVPIPRDADVAVTVTAFSLTPDFEDIQES